MPSQALNPIMFSYLKRNFEKLSESSKGVAGGVAALDANSLVPVSNIPPLPYLTNASVGVANGVASLGADGKILGAQLPTIAITNTFTVGSQAEMLALVAQTGDVAIRTDLSMSFILQGADPTVLAGWQELLVPTSAGTPVAVSKYNITGPLVSSVGVIRWYPERSIAIGKVYFSVGTAPTGNATIDVKKNGVSIFSGVYPTCSAGQNLSSSVTVSVSVATTDYITVDVISPYGAANAVVYIVYQ